MNRIIQRLTLLCLLLATLLPAGNLVSKSSGSWWETYDPDSDLKFVHPRSGDDNYLAMRTPDSVYVSLSAYMRADRVDDTTRACRMAIDVAMANHNASKKTAKLDGRKLTVTVNTVPMKITTAKQLVVKYGAPVARIVLEAEGSLIVHPQGQRKRSPAITIKINDAVTIGDHVIAIDSVMMTTARPMAF